MGRSRSDVCQVIVDVGELHMSVRVRVKTRPKLILLPKKIRCCHVARLCHMLSGNVVVYRLNTAHQHNYF